MRQLLILLLALFILIEPLEVQALKNHQYQLSGEPSFAKANSIPGSPFFPGSSLPSQKQLAISSLAAFPAFNLFLPAGFMWLGSVNVTNSVVTLINQSNNLNKIMKELNSQKTVFLLPYLGRDGLELLQSFLYAKQTVIDQKGNRKSLKPFSSNGQRHKGVSALMMRDLLDNFIQQYQKKRNYKGSYTPSEEKESIHKPKGRAYIEHLTRFLSQLGYVTWSDQTIHTLKRVWPDLPHTEREKKLYTFLHDEGFLDKDGAPLAKKSTSSVQKALVKHHFPEKLQKQILHDLGLIHREDMTLLENEFPELTQGSLLKEPFRERLEQNIPKVLTSIEKTLDRAPKSPNDFKDKLDLAILQGLLSSEEIHYYKEQHHISYHKKNISDPLIVHKLALVESMGQKKYNYVSLDEDLQLLQAWIIKILHSQNINNEVYRIVCMKNEDVVIPSLTFVTGVGYITLGVIKTISFTLNIILQYKVSTLTALVAQTQAAAASGQIVNNASQISQLQSQIQTLTHIIQALGLVSSTMLVCAGTINMALNSYFIITKLMELKRLSNSKKIRELLDHHLQETTEDAWLDEEGEYKKDLTRFNALSEHYLKKLKQKSIINSVGLNCIWLAFACLQTINGITALLIILGVTVAISVGAFIGTGYGMFVSFAAIPIAILLLREIKLKERLAFATRTVQVFQLALAQKQPELDHKHQLLIRIFLKNIKHSMDFATYGTEIKYYLDRLSQKYTFQDIETKLVNLYHCRSKALKHWEKLNEDPETELLLEELVRDELVRNRISLHPSVTHKISASTFRSGVDVLIDALHPGMSINPTANFLQDYSLPPCNPLYPFERDTILSKLFNYTFQIYNNIRTDIVEYRYLLQKRNLQMHYFQVPLSKGEQNQLLHRYADRRSNSTFSYGMNNFQDQIGDLNTVHHPLPKGKLVAWDEELLPQLWDLLTFNKGFKQNIKALSKPEEDEPTLEVPDHSRVDLLIQYFLPLSLAK